MGRLYLVPTPVGNLDDMTFRAIKVLKEVDVILAEDTRTTGILLKHYGIENHLQSHHKFNEHETAQGLAMQMKCGETMALVTDAGTPAISDPGFMLTRACVEVGVEVQCLPGATFCSGLGRFRTSQRQILFLRILPQKKDVRPGLKN